MQKGFNTHAPSAWCVHSTFAYEDFIDPFKNVPW